MSKRNRKQRKAASADPAKQLEKAKRIQSLKALYFNRFMLVRYTTAACFFGNFNYAFMAWPAWTTWLAIALIGAALPALWQLGTMYGKRKVRYQWVQMYIHAQWVFNALLMVSIWTLPMEQVIPFFSETMGAKLVASAFDGIGLILLSLCVIRLRRISSNTDKVFKQIHFYEQKYNFTIESLR